MQTPRDQFQKIKETQPSGIDNDVLTVMLAHKGKSNKIGRRALIESVFRVRIFKEDDLYNMTYDRQLRMSIARLQSRHPILGSSGESGYYYAATSAEVYEYTEEINSRAMKLLEKKSDLERIARNTFGPQMHLPGA